MTLIVFLITLSILVFVHEFGHFITAKKNGIRVEEFGLGMPPKIFGKKIGETEYTLNWLPFGGFVKLTGEDATEAQEEGTSVHDEKSFASKSPLQRAVVISAGVVMNFLLAVIIYYVLFFITDFRTFTLPLLFDHEFRFGDQHVIETVITDFQDDSAAKEVGAEVGEAVISIDGERTNSIGDVRNSLKGKEGREVTLELLDLKIPFNEKPRFLTAIPSLGEDGNAVLGTYMGEAVYITYSGPYQKVFSGLLHSYNVMDYSISTLGKIFRISIREKDLSPVSESVAGPVGIYNLVGGILEAGGNTVILSLMDYVAIMSLSLAFINILPFPALDGGRLLFIIIEGIIGKKINPVIESRIHRFGLAFLL